MKIRKVTIKEDIGIKKSIQGKLIESDSNACFIFYENEITKKRSNYTSISTYDLIQKKLRNEPILERKEGYKIITLQSNDLVYVPTKEEREKGAIDWSNKKCIANRLYRVNDFSKTDIYFKPNTFAKAIKSKELHTSFDDKCSRIITYGKSENEDTMIKEFCIKVKFDRLGNINPLIP